MSPQDLDALAPLIAFLVVAFVVSIPIIALSIRFAAKPLVDAMVRLREVQGRAHSSEETMLLHDRRMNLLESELQHITSTLDRLAEAERFRARLEAPRVAEERALPAETPRAAS
jgi:hypothetical protein